LGNFLRDEQPKNVSINESTIREIHDVFVEHAIPIANPQWSYVIRFDRKGYRVSGIEDLIRHFKQAKHIERLAFIIDTPESLGSNRLNGTYFELRLDVADISQCVLIVSSDNRNWVDTAFSSIHDILSKHKTLNAWARSSWTLFGVQIVGVMVAYILSVWVAQRIAPSLSIANPFIMAFIFVLVMLSNVWTYLSQIILKIFNATFPNIKFDRPDSDKLYKIKQGLVVSFAVAITWYVIDGIIKFLSLVGNSIVH
jgi:hypothetical protein